MNSDSEDALSWDGDDGASKDAALPRGWNAVGRGSDKVGRVEADGSITSAPDDRHPSLSTASLLALGIIGGIYLLYSIGWVVGGLRLHPLASFIVADAMYIPWFVLAVAAPAFWFLATWVLTRGRAGWIRIGLLVLGVVLLVPWPFVTVGVIGS